jgi:hypothetical protein
MSEHMAEWGMTSIHDKHHDVKLQFGMKIPNKNQENKQLIKPNLEITNNKVKKYIKK